MVDYNKQFGQGRLRFLDDLQSGDPKLAASLKHYTDHVNQNKQSLQWQRTVKNIENLLFLGGRHYITDILMSRLSKSQATDDLSIAQDVSKNIPRPTNDLLGRYVDTNVSLVTENRPRPRVTPKSDEIDDIDAAELSELVLEYLWEANDMPEKHRELARIVLTCGTAWMEVIYDPTMPRRIRVPETKQEQELVIPESLDGGAQISKRFRDVPAVNPETGEVVFRDQVEFGDISTKIVTPFELHFPTEHYWDSGKGQSNLGWVMREEYVPIDEFVDRYTRDGKTNMALTRANGWYLENLPLVKEETVANLPLWWWSRVSEMIEGPGPSVYLGSKDQWEGYTIVRIFDRKPNKLWPKGRTIITAGDQVIYDSPKKIGARAYDPRWPNRWHPYVRFRWEALTGNIYGRSLVSKLLPSLKRINSIDTTMIMYRRTVPIATWLVPKGSHVTENLWAGGAGQIWTYDPRTGMQAKPEPIYPPDFPSEILEERQQQLLQMDAIAGTEQILKGERPVGISSAAALDILRKQVLASRSSILQSWDESLQDEGSFMLQEVIKHIKDDGRYAQHLKILSRERKSEVTIGTFSGTDISDNVAVRIDTASLALASKEAREAKMIEIMQYLPGLAAFDDINVRNAMLGELGLANALTPSGPDVHRCKRMIAMIKGRKYNGIGLIPLREDDIHIFYNMLVGEMKSDWFTNADNDQRTILLRLIEVYRMKIEAEQLMMQQQQMAMMELQMSAAGKKK
jgi:hypothetical protein